jgi:hypothetical protein
MYFYNEVTASTDEISHFIRDKNYGKEARPPMQEMTKLEMGLGVLKARVDHFIENVGKVPIEPSEENRAVRIELLVQQSGTLRSTAAVLLDMSEVLQRKTTADVVVARRCAKLLSTMEELRGKFDSACHTLEQTRRLFLSGLN